MNSTVVLYVTRTGHCRLLAEKVAGHYGVNPLEIIDLVDRSGTIGFLKTGAQAAKAASSPIIDPNADLASATRVILIQPMWAFSIAPPLRSWLVRHASELKGKKVGLLSSQFGTPAEAMRKRFEEEFFKLAAFMMVPEKLEDGEKNRLVEEFIQSLA